MSGKDCSALEKIVYHIHSIEEQHSCGCWGCENEPSHQSFKALWLLIGELSEVEVREYLNWDVGAGEPEHVLQPISDVVSYRIYNCLNGQRHKSRAMLINMSPRGEVRGINRPFAIPEHRPVGVASVVL